MRLRVLLLIFILCLLNIDGFSLKYQQQGEVAVDLSGYNSSSPVQVEQDGNTLTVEWQSDTETRYQIKFDVSGSNSLIESISLAELKGSPFILLAEHIQPDFQVTIGSRSVTDRPYVFFDLVHTRPYETFPSVISLDSVKVKSDGGRVKLTFSSISSGSFYGDLICNIYTGSPLIYWEATMTTDEYAVAYIYDGLFRTEVPTIVYQDNLTNNIVRKSPDKNLTTLKVRYRTLMVEYTSGTMAIFPPPHASFWPFNKWIPNNGFLQAGEGVVGTRQDTHGDATYSPWVDAPVGKYQRMGAFLLLSPEKAEETLDRVKLYTNNDKFKIIDGYKTFTGHYHPKLTRYELEGKPEYPEAFKKVMKDMNVQIVHMAEFHCCGDWNGRDVGVERLNQLKGMFDLTEKYSDDEFVFLPGEEANAHWGGPWNYLFPKPVYFVKSRESGEPFMDTIEPYGTVYRLGNDAEVYDMLKRENGIAYTSHPRMKGSVGYPDRYANKDFFKDDEVFLGAEWKAAPSDLSEPRLGRRVFKLQDDMNQWGLKKRIVGAVDVFYPDSNSSLYSQMNINYLKLDSLPSPDNYPEVLDVLKKGDFFVSTGEVLLHSHAILPEKVTADIEWTFPLEFAEIIWGEGNEVKTHSVSLTETEEFGRKTFEFPVDLSEATWARFEVWDIARNGAFTQTTWLKEPVQVWTPAELVLSIESFTLINADTDYPIPAYEIIPDGDTLDLNLLPTRNLNIRANPGPMAASRVIFDYDGILNYHSEGSPPYAMASDEKGDYYAWTPTPGKHSVKATPYDGGTPGNSLTLNFTVVDSRPVAIEKNHKNSSSIQIGGVSPNPFNHYLNIRYNLSNELPENLQLKLYNTLGMLVQIKVIECCFTKGDNSLRWNLTENSGLDLSPGLYILRIEATMKGNKIRLLGNVKMTCINNN